MASLLLPGGRTTHFRFAIPLSLNEDSTCNISQGSDLAELIIKSKLIIWDEAPMMHKHRFVALDKTMSDILRFAIHGSAEKTFGGKKVVLARVLRLTKNLRLRSLASDEDKQTVNWFSKWIADIEGEITGVVNDGLSEIDIPVQFLLKCRPDLIATIVENAFPSARYGMLDESHLEGRAILSPTLDVVDQINQYMCDMNTAEGRTHLSCDSLCKAESDDENLSESAFEVEVDWIRLLLKLKWIGSLDFASVWEGEFCGSGRGLGAGL
ncbi:PREDICTED: uncharacterized protein LOC109149248 [Ipomoea nil]|uniref:uncharacterized protein LOC109149248 n=1 Tax=Ipomoea nil TaxID=35883 RepID=UPI000900A771|nr:PREDICTED: uncharacterized protein LOC109149248 [Ipomoea nil]